LINQYSGMRKAHTLSEAAHIERGESNIYTRHVSDLRFIPGAAHQLLLLWSMSQSKIRAMCDAAVRALYSNNLKLLHECNNNNEKRACTRLSSCL
jgi:hypothetical protein